MSAPAVAAPRPRSLLTTVVLVLAALTWVAPAATAAPARTLSVAANPTGAVVKKTVAVAGTLTNTPRGSAVVVQRKSAGRWVTAKTTKTTTAAGAYSVRVAVPAKVGTYSYRALAPARGGQRAVTSKVIRISALTPVTATIKATPKPPAALTAGARANLSGTVKPFKAGTTVTIQRFANGRWVSTGVTTKVSGRGTFATPAVVRDSSVFRVSVPRAGMRGPAVSIGTAVIANPAISSTSLPVGARGEPYSAQLTQVGTGDGTWSVSPELPAALKLNEKTGRITGTPTAALATKSFTFRFAQPALVTATKVLDLRIEEPQPPGPPVIATTTLTAGTVGTAYSATLSATGNPAGTWSTSALPGGLTLAPSTGVISGTPTTAGSTEVTVNFTQTSTGLQAAPKVVTLVINPPPPPPRPVIATQALPDAQIGASYSFQVTAVGNPPGTWSATGLPSGFAINATTGVISTTFLPPLFPSVSQVTLMFTATGNPTPAVPVTLTLTIK